MNALSTRFDVEVKQKGFVWRHSFADGGIPQQKLEKGEATDETEPASRSGRMRRSSPNRSTSTTTPLRTRFQQMAFLNKGLRIDLRDERESSAYEVEEEGATITKQPGDVFFYERGLVGLRRVPQQGAHAEVVNDEIIAFESEDTQRKISLEVAMQWTTSYTENVFTYAKHDQHHEGGTHEEGFRAALTTLVKQVRPCEQHPQGEGRQPLRRRRARGTHGGHLDQAGRAAVRGSDQDQARQHRGEGFRAEGRRRSARRLVRTQPGPGQEHHPQGSRRGDRSPRRPQGPRDRTSQERLRVGGHAGKLKDCTSKDPSISEIFLVEGDSAGGSGRAGSRTRTPRRSWRSRQDPQRRARAVSTRPWATRKSRR